MQGPAANEYCSSAGPASGTMLSPLLFRNFYYDTHAPKGASFQMEGIG